AALTSLCFTARTLWLVPHAGELDLRLPWWQQPLASPYALLGLALLAAAALPRRPGRTRDDPVPVSLPPPAARPRP
ncbi:transferase, partial [Streptomyces sp. SID625]|nr:transferase [Streptomyces sp. SID625]